MGPMTLLTVRGRKSGHQYTTPVGLFEHDGRRYVFGTFGEVNWVRNLRATGRAIIGRGLRRRPVNAVELGEKEGARVLQAILAPYLASRARRSFLRMGYDLKPNASPVDFAKEAQQHPGFELQSSGSQSVPTRVSPSGSMSDDVNYNSGKRPDWVDSDLFPFESKWIDVDGHLIHYVDEGPQSSPVLLFLHPGAGWSFTYRYHIQRLRDRFRCVAPDLPGYGLSKASNGYGFTLLEQGHALGSFVKALDLKNIVVWANDSGGPTGVLGLSEDSDRVTALVVDGTFGWSIKEYPSVSRMLRLVTNRFARLVNHYTNFLARSMGSKLALGTRTLSQKERRQYLLPFKDRNTRSHALKLYGSFNDHVTQQELNRCLSLFREKPILIQFGEGDPMTGQRWHERWAEEFPDHRVFLLPGVRHFTFEGAPEATVRNFIQWWHEIGEHRSAPNPLYMGRSGGSQVRATQNR